VTRDDEIGDLSNSFNTMIDTTQDLITNLDKKIELRTSELIQSNKKMKAIHKHTLESIEYASLIQSAILPDDTILTNYFKDNFVMWKPKDTVGGDIWLFNELRHKDECLLYFIDCTGHGVPGAFVTMIVKAIEQQILAKIEADRYRDISISPAWIMGYFNQTMKKLLKQETQFSRSNAGFDGGIIYYNRRTQVLKFSGAETSLFYTTKDGELKTVKGNRYSVGYKKCDSNYEYKETIIDVQEGMKFYCTTDGYLDQNGGAKGFPFGKKRFTNIIKEHYKKDMKTQQIIFKKVMEQYESEVEDNDINDDMTLIAFEIDKKSNPLEREIQEIIKYEGIITQNVVSSCMDNIEFKIHKMNIQSIISTITIEYCQNMMNYSKNAIAGDREITSAGSIDIKYINHDYYEITSVNIVAVEDKQKIEPKLKEVQILDKQGIKKRYRELRKSGQNTHSKGGGIGVYEIAKISDYIEYEFININDDKYYFTMTSIVHLKKKEQII
jgi:serine phosphatase RsbU (regulator of sigma subunit)